MSSVIPRDEHSSLPLSLAAFDTGDDEVYLSAEASMKRFVGRNTSVGVSRRIWNAFIVDLSKLETARAGEARLVSMSPAPSEFCWIASINLLAFAQRRTTTFMSLSPPLKINPPLKR